jgi:hypothetical protein
MATMYLAQFVDALAAAFPSVAAFKAMLSMQLGWELERIAGEGTLDERIRAVIFSARKRGLERDLLAAALAVVPDSLDLQAIEPLLSPPSPLTPIDDFEICYFQRLPFIDRRGLRKAVKRLASDDGPRLLVIQGPQLSGKTYSTVYINHVAGTRDFEVVQIDLKTAYPGETITADLIACDVALQMGLPPPPQSREDQAPRRTRTYANWLTGKLRDMRGTWWIVIDGCNDALPSDVLDLFQEMAQRIVRAWNNVRLVLVHDGTDVGPLPGATPEREAISPIDQMHITEFLMQFRQQLRLPDDDAEVGRVLAEIMRRVDPDSPERMRMIGTATAEQCRLMLGE